VAPADLRGAVAALGAKNAAKLSWTPQSRDAAISDEPLYRRLKQSIDPDAVFGDLPA
jgi:hypothetical protein